MNKIQSNFTEAAKLAVGKRKVNNSGKPNTTYTMVHIRNQKLGSIEEKLIPGEK